MKKHFNASIRMYDTQPAYKEIFIVLRYRENERNVKEGKGKKRLKSLSLSSISFAGLNLSNQRNQMEKNPPRVSRKNGTHLEASRVGPTSSRKSRYSVVEDGAGGDQIECSGKHCKACTAGLIADCVALCCCPCAVVNFLALAFVKVPWMVGRRLWLGFKKKKKGQSQSRLETKRKCSKRSESSGCVVVERDIGNERRKRVDQEDILPEIASGLCEEEGMESGSARFEAERVWLELYQVGHLGFGRVSFTGIQSLGKGN